MEGDGTKGIRGVDTAPKGREPRGRGRGEVAGSHTETIGESKYPDGQTRHGINPANVHRDASTQHYKHPEQAVHRRGLGSQPYPGKR